MKEFLRHPIFWIRETLRWHWLDVLIITAGTWTLLLLVLALVNLIQ